MSNRAFALSARSPAPPQGKQGKRRKQQAGQQGDRSDEGGVERRLHPAPACESEKSRVRIAAQRAVHCQPQCKKSQSRAGTIPCRPRLRAALLSYDDVRSFYPQRNLPIVDFLVDQAGAPGAADRARTRARPPVRPAPLAGGPGCVHASLGRRDGFQGRTSPGAAAAVSRRHAAPGGSRSRRVAVAGRARTLARGRTAGSLAGRYPLAGYERTHRRSGKRARPGLGLWQLPVRHLQIVDTAGHGAGTSHRAVGRRPRPGPATRGCNGACARSRQHAGVRHDARATCGRGDPDRARPRCGPAGNHG